jgi:hypothetical protein
MALGISARALLGFGLALIASAVCGGQAEESSLLADRQSAPCRSTKMLRCRSVLPLELDAVSGVTLVSVRVNGKLAVLILDTGSNTTILSPEAAGLDPVNLRRADPPKKGTGFVKDGHWGEATLVTGARTWRNHRVLVADMTQITSALHRKIDGVLGQDILDEFKHIEIDFEHKWLVLGSD